jgi:hypothetical protein
MNAREWSNAGSLLPRAKVFSIAYCSAAVRRERFSASLAMVGRSTHRFRGAALPCPVL